MRIGIIGIGFGQHVLLPAFRLVEGVEVYGIAATTLERAQKVATEHGIPRAYCSWQEMVDDPSVDAIAIAVPPKLQEDIIEAALFHNKHLFCEKPLALSSKRAQQFMQEARRRNLVNMVDFEFCGVPAFCNAKQALEKNTLGKTKLGVLNWQTETYVNRMKLDHWKKTPSEGGGALFNFASHVFYNLEWLCGAISEVLMTVDDQAIHGIVKFQDGLVFSVCIGTSSKNGSGQRIEVYGDKGSLQLVNNTTDVINGFMLTMTKNDGAVITETFQNQPTSESNGDGRVAPVSVLAKRFAHWIISGNAKEPSFSDGYRVNLLLQACLTSHQNKKWVIINN